ncbi:hypothetical protein CRG98_008157 [Punica granatum]|nr:hypothetical protein CRG98_008157 [Punica granatum]
MEAGENKSSGKGTFDRHNTVSYVSEIEGVEEDSKEGNNITSSGLPLASIKEDIDHISLCSYGSRGSEDCVYVGVGKSESSMDALTWSLNHAIGSGQSTTVYLVHVFPEIRYIPSPLGNLPVSRVNREQLESFMAQERGKRRELLQNFLNSCHASKVKVDTMLIESDMVAKAILDLIPVLNIKKLVVGTPKSNLRKLRARKGNGIADQILQNIPESCNLKIICGGNQVVLDQLTVNNCQTSSPPSRSQSPRDVGNGDKTKPGQEGMGSTNGAISCMCFRSNKFV